MTARHLLHRWAGGDRGIDQAGSRRRRVRVHGRLRSTRTYVGRQFRLTTLLRTPADSASVLVAGAAAAPATRRHPRRPSWAPVPVRSTFRPSAAHKKLVLAHRFTPVSGGASEEPRRNSSSDCYPSSGQSFRARQLELLVLLKEKPVRKTRVVAMALFVASIPIILTGCGSTQPAVTPASVTVTAPAPVTVTATPKARATVTEQPPVTVTAQPPVTVTALPPVAAPARPPIIVTEQPDRYGIFNLPSGLLCRDLKAQGYTWANAIDYWNYWGQPDNMDIDLNGIPCETVY